MQRTNGGGQGARMQYTVTSSHVSLSWQPPLSTLQDGRQNASPLTSSISQDVPTGHITESQGSIQGCKVINTLLANIPHFGIHLWEF